MTRSVITFNLKPGKRDEFAATFRRISVLEVSSFQAGYLGGRLLASVQDPDVAMVIADWESPAAYQGWLDNPDREGLGEQLDPFLAEDPEGQSFVVLHEVAPATAAQA